MEEVEYKLNTKNSVFIVNAVDKLISMIKSKFKPTERQRFVNENEELRFLREKCSSEDANVSLTACQGLLALVELGVLEIAHTMSTVITLLPSAHNYSAIISTMAGLLILDLKSRIVPHKQYQCQFTLKSPQHPFITVLEKNNRTEDDVLAQMHSLCTHHNYLVSSHSLELLQPVFLWLTCHPHRDCGIRPWQLLLSLPQSAAQSALLLACLSCQQICNPASLERSYSAYSAVTEAAINRQHCDLVITVLPMLARISTEMVKHGRDPRPCYSLIDRCLSQDGLQLNTVAGFTLFILSDNLVDTPALYIHELFNLGLNIISKYQYSAIHLNTFVALSVQWLHQPSYLTSPALKIASKIFEIYQNNQENYSTLQISQLRMIKTFETLLHTDSHLSVIYNINYKWQCLRDNPDKFKSWLNVIASVQNNSKLEFLPFLFGIFLDKCNEDWYEDIVLSVVKIVVDLVSYEKRVAVQVLPLLVYKIGNDNRPAVKMACLTALPLMATAKENVPTIMSILNKLKSSKGAPTSFLIMLFASLAETQVRCFPYLQELLVDPDVGRAGDLKWEVDIAKAYAVKRICQIRASSHGLELVPVISSTLNRCGDMRGVVATSACLQSLALLWREAALAPPSTWKALEPKLGRDIRPPVLISVCKLLGEVPALRVSNPEYDSLITEASRKLWTLISDSHQPEVVEAACDALGGYKIEDFKLKDIPAIYRKTVKLPASFCKTPSDAERNPEDVLDYVPCEVWPEVFKHTNHAALPGVSRLASRLVEREVRAYRSGVYAHDPRNEPTSLSSLPATSVVRGLMDFFRKQATSPVYTIPDMVLLSVLETLSGEYSRPLPPTDMCFLPDVIHRGTTWRRPGMTLAARQAQVAQSARRIVESYLKEIIDGDSQELDTLLIFEILPILCRSMPSNIIRSPIESCISASYSTMALSEGEQEKESLFIKQIDLIRVCLECEKIQEANRTMLCQIVESYMPVLDENTDVWPTYVRVCRSLSTDCLERMTSPSSWWEVTSSLLRKATHIRSALCEDSLNWLNEIIDAQAGHVASQPASLRYMFPALAAASRPTTAKEWLLQLMGRTQLIFNETKELSIKLYYCDVFTLAVIVFSGRHALEPDVELLCCSRALRHELLPAAAAALCSTPGWEDCTLQMLEWLCHTRGSVGAPAASATCASCQRALLALRHTPQFLANSVWTKLESHFDRADIDDELLQYKLG